MGYCVVECRCPADLFSTKIRSRNTSSTPLLCELHWLRVPERITFPLATYAQTGTNTTYGAALPYCSGPTYDWRWCNIRRLRSASTASLFVPRSQHLTSDHWWQSVQHDGGGASVGQSTTCYAELWSLTTFRQRLIARSYDAGSCWCSLLMPHCFNSCATHHYWTANFLWLCGLNIIIAKYTTKTQNIIKIKLQIESRKIK
jgi:hypothetical protein